MEWHFEGGAMFFWCEIVLMVFSSDVGAYIMKWKIADEEMRREK